MAAPGAATDEARRAPDGTPLSPEQSAVLDLIESTREHVFVTGRAGTGKSTLLETYLTTTERTAIVCAPTGVAALNVGGQTIHSLFRLPIGLIADHDLDDLLMGFQNKKDDDDGYPAVYEENHRTSDPLSASSARRSHLASSRLQGCTLAVDLILPSFDDEAAVVAMTRLSHQQHLNLEEETDDDLGDSKV